MDAILEENQPQADSRDEKSKHQQEEEDASIARGLLLNYEAVKGTFPAIAATEELSLTKLATMQSPALLTQNLVGKANFDSPVLSPKKEAEAPAAGEGKKKGKKVRRSQTLRVVKTDEAGGKSPLALAHMTTSSDIGEKEIKTKYSKDAVIDVKNFNHQEKKEDYADETSFFKRTAKSITRSRKSKIDLTKDNSVRAKSVLADSSHVTPLNDGGKYTVTPKKEMTTPLMLACLEGHVAVAEVLLQFGAFVDSRRSTGSTALFLAAQCGQFQAVELLLQYGALMDAQNKTGGTPLFAAAQMGHVDIVELLCANGANVHLSLKDRTTPIFVAAQNGHLDVVCALERYHADVNCRREDGVSPLWIASQMGEIEIVKELCVMGALVDKPRNSDGVTPLFKAATKGHAEVVYILLKRFPNTGILKCGYTPLHAAALYGHLAVAKVLLEHGVKTDVTDKDGLSAADVATSCGFDELAELLLTSF